MPKSRTHPIPALNQVLSFLEKDQAPGVDYTSSTEKVPQTDANLRRANLSYRYLNHHKFENCDLTKALMRATSLAGASLTDCDATGANFSHAKLLLTNFRDTNLTNAMFASTDSDNISSVEFDNSNLTRADFRYSHTYGTSFKGSNLTEMRADGTDVKMKRCTFEDSDMTDTNLSESWQVNTEIKGCNAHNLNMRGTRTCIFTVTDSDLTGANLSGIKPYIEELEYHTPVTFTDSKLVDADLSGIEFTKVRFNDVDLTGASLARTKVPGHGYRDEEYTFSGANLTEANLLEFNPGTEYGGRMFDVLMDKTDVTRMAIDHKLEIVESTIRNTNFGKVKFRKKSYSARISFKSCEIINCKFGRYIAPVKNLVRRIDFEYCVLVKLDLRKRKLDLQIQECEVENAKFTGAEINRSKLEKSSLAGSNFDKARISGSMLSESSFSGCSFVGADIHFSSANNADFSECVFTGATLQSTPMKDTTFYGASLKDIRQVNNVGFIGADFTNADCTRARFSRCDFTDANFTNTNFTDCAFFDCTFDNATWWNQNLAGARIEGDTSHIGLDSLQALIDQDNELAREENEEEH